MTDINTEQFEKLWQEQGYKILHQDKEYLKVSDSYKMTSGADWLLFGMPVIIGILFLDNAPIEHELLRWLASAVVTIVSFVGCVWVKSLITGTRSVTDVEKDVKERCYQHFIATGKLED